jgi:Na+-translocating ferredoxin:NAD+ oxidoreductase RnfE subunit
MAQTMPLRVGVFIPLVTNKLIIVIKYEGLVQFRGLFGCGFDEFYILLKFTLTQCSLGFGESVVDCLQTNEQLSY